MAMTFEKCVSHNDSATLLIAPDGQGMLRVRIKRLQQRMDKSQ